MFSSDPIVLQKFLDGELDPSQADAVGRHLENCTSCRDEIESLAADRSFVQSRLGQEDDGEEDAAATSLGAVADNLRKETAMIPWWRRSWVPPAAVVTLVIVGMLASGTTLSARPERILEEAASRQRSWMYQPDKTLAWEVDAISRGVKDTADGRWRTLFWQKNGPATMLQISRQYDPTGRVNWAQWMEPDGSSIAYRTRSGPRIEISPSIQAARSAMGTLDPSDRESLAEWLSRREMLRSLSYFRGRDSEWLHRPSARTGGSATVRLERADYGEDVFYLQVVNGPSETNLSILRSQHDYEIERSTLRLRRLRSTITYADGTTGVQDAHWSNFREISGEEFDSQSPHQMLQSGVPVVRLTPQQIAERYRGETQKQKGVRKE
jgi:hypothetical protein